MTRITRRTLIASAGIAAPALLTSRFATAAAPASNFPFKPIRFIIPYAPGGGFDVYVRMIAPVMEQFLPRKVSIIPLNVSGGGGARGVIQLYRARPDGYTLGIFNILSLVAEARRRGLDFVYLGYWLGDSRKMSYKKAFRPAEVWSPIRGFGPLSGMR